MSDYYYYTSNGKKTYGGKRAKSTDADGYHGNNDAGDKRKFKGSNLHEYVFTKKGLGTYTVVAVSYEDALRLAKIRGYSSKDYKSRKRSR